MKTQTENITTEGPEALRREEKAIAWKDALEGIFD